MTCLPATRQQMISPVMALPGGKQIVLASLALLVVPAMLGGKNLPAQTRLPQATTPAQQQLGATKPAQATIAAQPPASPAPIWPANPPLNQARVIWDRRGLEIDASNSSLNQILHQVAAETGAKLEGLIEDHTQDQIQGQIQDQRIFGRYGPGPGCDVLSKLLDGAGYNVLMTGCRDADAPRKIILSTRLPASPQTAANTQNRIPPEPEPPPDYPAELPHPQPNQNPFANGEPPREPLRFMQEILERQQKIDQQQQRQDRQNSRSSDGQEQVPVLKGVTEVLRAGNEPGRNSKRKLRVAVQRLIDSNP